MTNYDSDIPIQHMFNRLYADIRDAEAALKRTGLSKDEKRFWNSQKEYARNKIKLYLHN